MEMFHGMPSNNKEKEEFNEVEIIFDDIMDQLYSEFKGKHAKKESLIMQDNLAKKIISRFERLHLHTDLAIWINTIYQNKFIKKNEAEFLLKKLKRSEGEDNLMTLALLQLLYRLDLSRWDREFEEDNKKMKKTPKKK